MKTVYIIILVTTLLYLIGGYVMYLGWPTACKEGQTSDSIDPIEVNDAIRRDCESVWSHYYPPTDQADRSKWTQLVIDLAIGGRFNCWDISSSNDLIVTEIIETSNPGCNTGSDVKNEKSLNIASMIDALGGDQSDRDIYRLNAMTKEQADVVAVGCADCSLSLKLDTDGYGREQFTVDAASTCLVSCDPDREGCELYTDACWGPCHGTCGSENESSGKEFRKWIMNTAPGPGGVQCANLAPDGVLDYLRVDNPVIDIRYCIPDTCPGCCVTNTGEPLDTCNKHTGKANHKQECIDQAYNGKTGASKECQWSEAGAEADDKFFADDSLCMYVDVVEENSSAVIDNETTTADKPFDMKCRWQMGSTTPGRCLPTRPITEDEEIEDIAAGNGGTTCTNDSLYKDFSDTCQPGFDINNPNPSKIFALKSSGWRGIDEDPDSIRGCAVNNDKESCHETDDCRWIESHSGSCNFIKPAYMKFHPDSGTEAAYKQVCKDQHAINSYIQTAYNEMNGVCEHQTNGLRISLTSIPNYGGDDGAIWDSSDGAHGWLWTNFDRGGAATMEAATELLDLGDVAIPGTSSTFRLSGTPILQEHPLIDGDTESASSYNVNHYSVWIPDFSVTAGTTLAALKSHFDSKNFKDTKGRKIVVSNLDNMTIGSNGSVSYTENSEIALPEPKGEVFTDDKGKLVDRRRIVDQRQCMIDGSVLKWRSGGIDGDHPVIDGTIWRPAERTSSVTTSNHNFNCEPLPGVEPDGDDTIDVISKSIWWETDKDESNGSNKFAGFMNPYEFSNIHPNNAGGSSSLNPSYLTKQVKKLGGVRCRDKGDDFDGRECRAKRWDKADFDHPDCSVLNSKVECNNLAVIPPKCNWEAIESPPLADDPAVKAHCENR